MPTHHDTLPLFSRGFTRRAVCRVALLLGMAYPGRRGVTAQEVDPRNARPQAGDHFVFAAGERKGQVITLADLAAGDAPLIAYPMDPGAGTIRDGSRLNQVMFLRLTSAEMTEATRARAVEGVVAYSAICTHAGCDIWTWQGESQTLKCPCHDSEFDPKEDARVLNGPAPRRLAALPLRVVDGVVMAASGFVGRVGFKQD